MSLDSFLNNVQSAKNAVDQGVATIGRLGKDLGAGSKPAPPPAWHAKLRPASYRGIRFGVLGSEGEFGRRSAVHTYPFRDTVWVEDLGRMARRISMTGFLVGDDVIAQRERLIEACESKDGGAELVHPTLGRLTVSLAGALKVTERWDRGRYFEIQFSFIESGERVFPGVQTSARDAVNTAANAADAAAKADFLTKAATALKQGAAVVQQAMSTAASWAAKVQKLANDATNLYNMVGTLKGSFGRFFGGRIKGGLSGKLAAITKGTATVRGLISLGVTARANVSSAIEAFTSAASRLGQ